MNRVIIALIPCLLSGCAQSPPAQPLVKTDTVHVTSTDFCDIMRALYPTGKPTWSVEDTPESITNTRRLNAAFDKRCVVRPKNTIPIT